jgi:thymidine kinase
MSVRGKIVVYTGPMFASKTTRLLSQIERESYRMRPEQIVLIKHSIDARHGSLVVGTHQGSVKHASMVADMLLPITLDESVRVVCIDEGQFFSDCAEAAMRWCDQGKHVYVACLDLDSNRRPWDSVAKLLCYASHVEKCQAVCECGEDAVFSYKRVMSMHRIQVGDEKEYTALCSVCFLGKRADAESK